MCVQVSFEDVIAEPLSVRTGDRVWFWSNALFEVSRVWFYRIVTAVLAIPFSIVAGVLFAFLTCLHIWYASFNINILVFKSFTALSRGTELVASSRHFIVHTDEWGKTSEREEIGANYTRPFKRTVAFIEFG